MNSYLNVVVVQPRRAAIFLQGAAIVAKVLRGSKPAEVPAELPTKFELVINLKTAKRLGIVFPTPTLLRADEVIECGPPRKSLRQRQHRAYCA